LFVARKKLLGMTTACCHWNPPNRSYNADAASRDLSLSRVPSPHAPISEVRRF